MSSSSLSVDRSSNQNLEPPFPDMVWIPGATYKMGSDHHYPEERPVHKVLVDGFWLDQYPVTNARFTRFIETTGHITWAEIPPDPRQRRGTQSSRACSPQALGVKPPRAAGRPRPNPTSGRW